MNIKKEIFISSSLKKVYGTYADIEGWKNVLDDVVTVDLQYDDGFHQEFDMTVLRYDKRETVHSIRFCYPDYSIEIFQTQPPPFFKSMSGAWKFTPLPGGVLVQAMREFKIDSDKDFDVSVLEKFLEKNLTSFKKWIENFA